MGKMLTGLLQLQAIERDLMQVRRRLQTRKNAVAIQQKKIEQLQTDLKALTDKATARRMDADRIELELKTKEAHVTKLRGALNSARTNKEYATILTEINTHKADNAKVEEEILKIMADVDTIKAQSLTLEEQVKVEDARLKEVEASSNEEIDRLSRMLDQLTAQRNEAAAAVPPATLTYFDRMSANYDGEAMAVIEIHGRRPPFDYVCGGCYMQLNAEHANVLRVRDEIRTCDNCRRILYLEPEKEQASKD